MSVGKRKLDRMERGDWIFSSWPRHYGYSFRKHGIHETWRGKNLGTTEEQPIDAFVDVAQIGFIARLEFGDGAAVIADVDESLADGRPVNVAFAEIDPSVSVFVALEVLKMNFEDGGAEGVNPVLRVAVENDVADIEPSANERVLEFVDVSEHFERAKEELVPDFFDGDDHFELFGEREECANLLL